jgi:hypothetical protein
MCNQTWHEDKLVGSFSLERHNHRLICAIHPKPTDEYVKWLGISVFGDENFNRWFKETNFWHGDVAPKELTNKEVIAWLMEIIHGTYI